MNFQYYLLQQNDEKIILDIIYIFFDKIVILLISI